MPVASSRYTKRCCSSSLATTGWKDLVPIQYCLLVALFLKGGWKAVSFCNLPVSNCLSRWFFHVFGLLESNLLAELRVCKFGDGDGWSSWALGDRSTKEGLQECRRRVQGPHLNLWTNGERDFLGFTFFLFGHPGLFLILVFSWFFKSSQVGVEGKIFGVLGGKALISKNLLVDWDSWMLKVIQLCLDRRGN